MKFIQITAVLLLVIVISCNKDGYNYDEYLDGKEIIYTGLVSNLNANPGNQRAQLVWLPSSDRSIVKYVVKYNNRKDSIVQTANDKTANDTVKLIVPDLGESTHDFTLYTLDSKGNRSIGQTITAIKVYGPLYASSLRNRRVTSGNVNNTDLTLNFAPNVDTINVDTKITYHNNVGVTVDRFLHRDSSRIILVDWKSGEEVLIKSSFIPARNAIDVIPVSYVDTIKID